MYHARPSCRPPWCFRGRGVTQAHSCSVEGGGARACRAEPRPLWRDTPSTVLKGRVCTVHMCPLFRHGHMPRTHSQKSKIHTCSNGRLARRLENCFTKFAPFVRVRAEDHGSLGRLGCGGLGLSFRGKCHYISTHMYPTHT